MKSHIYLRALLLLVCGMLLAGHAFATHIRAGEITARRLNAQSFTYEITLRGYTDRDSEVIFGSNGMLDFGDGTFLQLTNDGDDIPRTAVSLDTYLYELTVEHTFPSARTFVVSFRELYRNVGVLNMANSESMAFYIETVIIIDPFLGVNNTPQLLIPPVDKAAIGKVYLHNPGAYDVDGDSLSYRLVVCRQDRNTPVANYRYPPNTFPAGDPRNGTNLEGGESYMVLDPLTGDLVWSTPGTAGEYNVAFVVEEWRKIRGTYYQLGYVTRDMQIIVEESDNEPPVLEIPADICVVAGEKIEEIIRVTDPDGDPVDLVAYGGVFDRGASFPGGTNLATPAASTFSWQTECADVRNQPYQVVFRAKDLRGGEVSLTDFKTLNIWVVGPPPEVDTVVAVGSRSVEVGFDAAAYACEQANFIQVWRREGRVEIPIDTCVTGMPAGYGYQLVDVRAEDRFPFVDDARGQGLTPGATYCYRFVALYPEPQGGMSLVSEEKCVTLPAKMPLITHVSVLETSPGEGEVLVRWMPGPDLEEEEVQPPYSYDLYRSEGFTGSSYSRIAENISDTVFLDQGLNTKDTPYQYYVMLKDANLQEIDSSQTASSVWLEPVPGADNITIEWDAQVPWSNMVQQYPLHTIYRNRVLEQYPDSLVQIAVVNVLQSGFRYTDTGADAGTGPLLDDVEYSYKVLAQGSYNNEEVPEPLLNFSQITSSFLRDEIPPCPPLEFSLVGLTPCEELLKTWECGNSTYENTLSWTANTGEVCGDDFAYWLVYYSFDGVAYKVVGQTPGNEFTHVMQDTLAGFYYIQAVDRSGNISEKSEVVMRDNCPNYWLPNVITRNGDGKNDVLRPPLDSDFPEDASLEEFFSRCPRFVESVHFKVFNRWGKQLYEYNSATAPEADIYIRWNGRTSSGEPVSNGTYYYIVDVTYKVLDPAKRSESIKGWVYVTDGQASGRSDTQ